jgi:putative intracellular protease/amidase
MKFNKRLLYSLLAVGVLVLLIAISLPSILHFLGLHPDYEGEQYDLKGKKALIVTTSHGVLNKPGETAGPPTGIFASEMTIPYYDFLDANMQVDVASIKGGKVPVDPQSFYYFVSAPEDERFLEDEVYQAKVENSIPVANVDFKEYDLVFFGGGWGAAYDMNDSIVAAKVSDAYYNSDVIFGSVCHGALAFTEAKDKNGEYLVKGRTMTGVTQQQLKTFGIEYTPYHPELELKKAGAIYKSESKKILEPLNTLTVIDEEKRFVTGQNQNSSHETAHLMMKTLTELK